MIVNGNLQFHTLGSGELRNAIVERLASAPTGVAGRIYYNTTDNQYYFYNGTTWVLFSDSAAFAALQTEVDNIEAGLGAAFNSSGVFSNATFASEVYINDATDITDALKQLDAAVASASGADSYGSISGNTGTASANVASDDITIAGTSTSGITTSASDASPDTLTLSLNLGTSGLTTAAVATGDYLPFADVSDSGNTKNTTVQSFLDTLDVPNAITTNGLVTRTAADTYTSRSVAGTTNRITLTNGDGVSGNPTVDIAATYVGQTSITTLGTITTGTWNGTTIAIANGGTGQTTATNAFNALSPLTTDGDLLTYSSGSNIRFGIGSDGQVLTVSSGAIAWATPSGGTVTSVAVASVDSGLSVSGSPVTTSGTITLNLDDSINAWDNFNSTGILVAIAGGSPATPTYASRTLVAPAAGITISNANGSGGNPTFALANDLAALEGLATTGYIVRTGDGTATTRSITGTTNRIVVSDGDGVATDTNIDLATVSQANSGNFVKVTIDGYGRVTGNTAVVASDITALVDATYVNTSGDTMTGNLNMGGNSITNLATPTGGTDATNKNYVDALVAGLSWKDAVRVATTANVAGTYDNGSGSPETGFGATLTVATDTFDGVSVVVGDRVLFRAQSSAFQNGIYVLTDDSGSPATYVFTRATDMDESPEFSAATVFVQEGTVYADSGWTQTSDSVTVGTTSVVWVQFTGAGTYAAGTGLSLSGNTFNVNLGAGIVELPSDEVGIDLFDAANGALILTTTGSNRTTVTGAQLYLLLDGAGALAQTSSGLKINAASVTNAMLVNPGVTLNADSGSGSLDLGQTLLVSGNSVQGIVTSTTGQTINVTASNASSSQKGVASFNSGHFSVSAGAVSLDATLDDLTNVSNADAAATGTLLRKTAGDWEPATVASVAADIDLNDLGDVTITSIAAGQVVVAEFTGSPSSFSAYVNKSIQFNYDSTLHGGPSMSHTVTHNLGQRFVNVTVYDSSFNQIIPNTVVLTSANATTVTFNTSIDCYVVVMGVPGVALA